MNSSYQAGTWKVGMKRQEFAHETVFGIRIIRSPAKRNHSSGGPGKCFCALPDFFVSVGAPQSAKLTTIKVIG